MNSLCYTTSETTVSGEVLSLPPVTREDMGNYMCIAQNGVPPAISKSYKLIVNCKYKTFTVAVKMHKIIIILIYKVLDS